MSGQVIRFTKKKGKKKQQKKERGGGAGNWYSSKRERGWVKQKSKLARCMGKKKGAWGKKREHGEKKGSMKQGRKQCTGGGGDSSASSQRK